MKKIRNNKGITLIALVVTIIVLIILAGVSINLVLGDNGILTKAKEAKEESNEAQIKEKMQLAVQEYLINRNTGDNTSLQDILRENLDESKIEEITENGKTAVVTYDGERIKIDLEKGTVGEDTPFDMWDGQSASEGLIGKGTKEEPYLIYSASDLYYMSQCVGQGYEATVVGLNEDKTENGCNAVACTANYKLMTNIALNDVTNYDNWNDESFDKTILNQWSPIGRNATTWITFSGSFDGNNYEITGMYIESNNDYSTGFITGTNDADIRNIRMTKVYLIGKSDVGGIIGTDYGIKNISNCYVSGYIKGTGACIGGIMGYSGLKSNGVSNITDCINEAKIEGGTYVAGITGKWFGNMNNCINYGEVIGTTRVAGLIGESSSATIKNSHNEGNITVVAANMSNYFAGCVAESRNTNIINCYNIGNIQVTDSSIAVGGIVGQYGITNNNNYEFTNVYNTGNITGNSKGTGGIIGSYYSNSGILTLTNCTNSGTITSNQIDVRDIIGNSSYDNKVVIK